MEVSVLGPVEVRRGGVAVDLGTPKQRALVAALALSRGWPVAVDTIVDLLWGDAAPRGVSATLQSYVSQLRGALEPERPRRAPAQVLVTVAPGYALRLPEEDHDTVRFERAVDAAHRAVQPLGWRATGPAGSRGSAGSAGSAGLEEVAAALDEALACWRGVPYAELGDAPGVLAERTRLEELRLVALEDRAVAALALGRHATVAAELEQLTARHPLRERLWALHAVALTRAGRQADALAVLARLREVLDEELGLEPSAELRELQTAVLRQDPDVVRAEPRIGPSQPRAERVPPEVAREPGGTRRKPFPAPVSGPDPQVTPRDPGPVAPWPMLGRDPELAALTDQLEAVARREGTRWAVVTGEPGIGKSRLAAELARRAGAVGVRVVRGRCTEDDGAPPLWPWRPVLEGLGAALPEASGPAGDGGQFRAWEQIADTVRAAAREEPLLVVLDDLHWADVSTLRVLRLLVDTTEGDPLMLVALWRSHPEPTGALAEVAETVARRHALRLALAGLPEAAGAELFADVAGGPGPTRVPGAPRPLPEDLAGRLHARTDGNPFFLVELARLAGGRGDGLRDDDLPAAVTDVLNRRLERLPEETVAALRSAAVVGRRFDTESLAAVTGIDRDELLDVVEPAQAAGLVREEGIDAYTFAHALVRDTLAAGLGASRRARVHARAAAALAARPGRESEVAWHWLRAGAAYSDRAWRACIDAAALAARLHAHDRSAELLEAALEALDGDAAATGRDRYDLLMLLVESYRWAARLPELVGAVEAAIEVGRELADPDAVARAAMATTQGVLWRSGPPGTVNEVVVRALRDSLAALPTEDGELRCRAMLALANELYEAVGWEERRALCDTAMAMARRLGDRRLVMDACQVSFVALWTPETACERLVLVEEALELGRALVADRGDGAGAAGGAERSVVVSACLRAVVLSELGRGDALWPAIEDARAVAAEQRILFGEVILDGLEIPWHAMAGRFAECERLLDHLEVLGRRLAHNNVDEAMAASRLALRLWQGRSAEMVPVLEAFDETPYPFAASIAVYLWRAGLHDRAREVYAERGAALDHDNDISLLAWAHAAELALYLGEAALGAGAYERLSPFAGRTACAGSSLAIGPVDAYLAMGAAAAGERGVAGRHADDALALLDAWGLPLAASWVEDTRRRYAY